MTCAARLAGHILLLYQVSQARLATYSGRPQLDAAQAQPRALVLCPFAATGCPGASPPSVFITLGATPYTYTNTSLQAAVSFTSVAAASTCSGGFDASAGTAQTVFFITTGIYGGSAAITVDTCGSGFDTQMIVGVGVGPSSGQLQCLATSDDFSSGSCELQSSISLNLPATANTTATGIYVVVGNVGTKTGPSVSPGSAPPCLVSGVAQVHRPHTR